MLHSDAEEKYLINNLKIKVRARMNNGNPAFITDSMYVWHPKYAVQGAYPGLGITIRCKLLVTSVFTNGKDLCVKNLTVFFFFFTSLQFSYV